MLYEFMKECGKFINIAIYRIKVNLFNIDIAIKIMQNTKYPQIYN